MEENKHITNYLEVFLNTEIEIEEIKELIDGSLNITVKSKNHEIDGKCYYIHWDKLYEINRKDNENNI